MNSEKVISQTIQVSTIATVPVKDFDFLHWMWHDLIRKGIKKFVKGSQEHGGLITDRVIDEEIDNELIDLIHYNYARKQKKLGIIKSITVITNALASKESLILSEVSDLRRELDAINERLKNL